MQPVGERSRVSDGRTDATVRVTVQEAADAFGVTVEAIRGRMHRGKYAREKDDEGRVWVLLAPDQLPNGRAEVRERSTERSGSSSGERSRTDGPNVYRRVGVAHEELVEELRGEVAYLKDVVATRDDELRRKDTIIMQMAQRIPELPPAPSPGLRDAPDTDAEAQEGAEHRSGTMGAQTDVQKPEGLDKQTARRPWWIRLFGG